MMTVNPFNITKAVDYSDEQINKFWVDVSSGGGFNEIVKPTSPMPMIIVGGKGSGKTHIMRYFSFGLQKLRNQSALIEKIKEDGYLGVYMRCSGLNSNRFSGKSQNEEAWKEIFSFYMELWLAQLLLNCIEQIFLEDENIDVKTEASICEKITDLFDIKPDLEEELSIRQLISHLRNLQKKVDYEVNNCALTGKKISDISIVVTPGSLIFGIPQVLSTEIEQFKDIKFMYLVDEFENLTENQQQYINTLIREKKEPSTFKIGSRLYGIRTNLTYSAGEEIKEGSEYEVYNIDKVFRDSNDNYKDFVKRICLKRLNRTGYFVENTSELNSYFDQPSFEDLIKRKIGVAKPYFEKLRKKLKGHISDSVTENIVEILSFRESIVLERTNVFLFYREWKKGNVGFLKSANEIKEDCLKYFECNSKETRHYKVLDKFKNDIQDQLLRELRMDVVYLGLDNFIKMSAGMPRNLLIILKHIFRWSIFVEEKPFENANKISVESQVRGLKEATKWFYNDARIIGTDGKEIQYALDRLGRFLQELRYSDIPPECSISSFSINSSSLDEKTSKIIEYLEQYSYLIKVDERREKNSNKRNITYKFNGLLSPQWELSIHRRGVPNLNPEDLKVIFSPQDDYQFESHLSKKLIRYNAPFEQTQPSLFKQ